MMKTDYYLRKNKVLHGKDIKLYPNTSGIAMNMLLRTLKYNLIKIKRNG
jgi:hypothetical protein